MLCCAQHDQHTETANIGLSFSAKQKPTAYGSGYVQLAIPVIPVESRFQAGRRTGIQFR